MDNEMSQEQEIAESFINGNISWCREQLRGNSNLLIRTVRAMQEYCPEHLDDFLRLMEE